MDKSGEIRNRKLLPRWREIKRTAVIEFDSASIEKPHVNHTDEMLDFYYRSWQQNPTLENALDVVCYAQLAQKKALAFGPAEQIIKTEHVSEETKLLALSVRKGKVENNHEIIQKKDLLQPSDFYKNAVYERIRYLKNRLIKEPGNSLVWLDLARLQTNLGNLSKAEFSLRHALAAAPNNRFVLRAAVRFYSHIGKADEGHDRIRKSEAIKYDPWIQSAEIAAAGFAGRKATSLKSGLAMVESKSFSPAHISELASSIGTEEYENGKTKAAKRLFRESLIEPTDNSVAQAFWVSKAVGLDLSNETLETRGAFEARAKAFLVSGNYDQAVDSCFQWIYDEPFSASPAIQGTFIASSLLDNHEKAIRLFEIGTQANPHDKGLLNNAVVAYCNLGQLDKARQCYRLIQRHATGDSPDPTIVATGGLLEFRSGNYDQGRALYEKSINSIKREHIDLSIRARMHWFAEEINAGLLKQDEINILVKEFDKIFARPIIKVPSITLDIWNKIKSKGLSKLSNSLNGHAPAGLLAGLDDHAQNEHI